MVHVCFRIRIKLLRKTITFKIEKELKGSREKLYKEK